MQCEIVEYEKQRNFKIKKNCIQMETTFRVKDKQTLL